MSASDAPLVDDRLLTASEVALMFRVHQKTVCRWGTDGLIDFVLTPGGRRRYRESDVIRCLDGR